MRSEILNEVAGFKINYADGSLHYYVDYNRVQSYGNFLSYSDNWGCLDDPCDITISAALNSFFSTARKIQLIPIGNIVVSITDNEK